jgi:chromosomal replication initiation ATPase DnaA
MIYHWNFPRTTDGILHAVAQELGVTVADMRGKCRKREFTDARRVYAFVMRKQGHTLQRIARELGRDHTSVILYLQTTQDMIDVKDPISAIIQRIEKSLFINN